MKDKAYLRELEWAVTGEIYGQTLFETAAETAGDKEISGKCRELARLEEETLARLRPLAEKYGLVFDEAPHREKGRRNGAALGARDWGESMRLFAEAVDGDIDRMEKLRAMASPEDGEALGFLVAHEVALGDFIKGQVNKDPDSLVYIQKAIDEIVSE